MGATSDAVAALDCGTNSTRLLVRGADGAELDRRMRITRLGEDVDATHKLAAGAIERTLAALREYRQAMDEHGVRRSRMVATSAARDADNADEFFEAAEAVTGVRAELLTGPEEGRLSFIGATSELVDEGAAGGGAELVVDIGGGSTELVVGTPSSDPAVEVRSLDIGCVRLTERFLRDDPPPPEQLAEARRYVDDLLAVARHELPSPAPGRVIGLAGTVSTLASLSHGRHEYDKSLLHHTVLPRAEVEAWLARLAADTTADRLARPGMVAGREDVIVGGVLILAAVMAAFDRVECLTSESDILDGLAANVR